MIGQIHDLVWALVPPAEFPAWWLFPAFGAVALVVFEVRAGVRHR